MRTRKEIKRRSAGTTDSVTIVAREAIQKTNAGARILNCEKRKIKQAHPLKKTSWGVFHVKY